MTFQSAGPALRFALRLDSVARMTKCALRLALFATASATIAACATNSKTTRTPANLVALDERVDSLFKHLIQTDGPGCAVGIYRDGAVVLTRGYGLANIEDGRPITPHTAFELGSVSKPFTALAALILEQHRKLSVDDDVRRWIPEFPDYGKPIHVRDLLEHTSGLRDYQALETLAGRPVRTMSEFLGLMAAQRTLNFATGQRHEYSHSDFMLLALVVERAAGVPFGAFLDRTVLEPIGMRDAFVSDERAHSARNRALGHVVSSDGTRAQFPESRTFGGVNLYASVEDMARWDRNFDDPRVGGRSAITRMTTLPVLANGDTIPYAYGLRLGSYRGLRIIERGGAPDGTRVHVIHFPDQRFGVAVLCNATHFEANKLAETVAGFYLGELMRPVRPRAPAPPAVTVSSNELARYAGVYRPAAEPWDLWPVELIRGELAERVFDDVRDDTLYVMTPAGNGRFFEIGRTGNVGIYTFESSSAGVPHCLQVSWNGGSADVLERVPDSAVWRPSAATLAEYAGVWFSEELDASWLLDLRDGRLFLRRIGKPDVTLWAVEPDLFIRGFGSNEILTAQLQFHRDGTGKLTHLSVSTRPGEESVRNVRFVRTSPR
ncbi:MAG: serine hydrolase domain-containing protein [Gemmatimonadales bacterium]